MPKQIPAEIIAKFLQDNKISHVFDIAGGMIAYIEDAINRHKGIDCVPCRHEQGCGFAAEGYARVSQNFGVAMATSGPGATNLITAIGSCYFDSVPGMFITGQVHEDDIRKDKRIRQLGFQETDIVSIVKPITKYAVQVISTHDVLYELQKGLFIAQSGRKGPVLIDIPINIQRTEIDLKKVKNFYGSPEHKKMLKLQPRAIPNNVKQKIAKLIKQSRRPIVLVGGGVRLSQTLPELKAFVEKNNLPVVCSLMGLDSFPGRHRLFAGFIGSYGTRHANMVFANADLIISLGSRLDVRQTGSKKFFAKHATIVHVDIDPYSIGANIKVQLPVVTDLKEFFQAFQSLATPPKENWLEFIKQVKAKFGPGSQARGRHIDPNQAITDICSAADKHAIVSVDVGNHQMWTAQSWLNQPGQRLLFSGGMGSMGFGLPAAIGAYFAKPDRQNILVCGDGGFQMNIQELETVRHNSLPLKMFIMNNNSLGMVKIFQEQYLKNIYQSTVIGYSHPDFKKIAAAFDLPYIKIEHPKKLRGQIEEVFKHKGAVLVEILLDIHTPMHPKIMYGHALDDQYPFLPKSKQREFNSFKKQLL